MWTFIKETWALVRLLFTKIQDTLEIVQTRYYPGKNYIAMMWCGKLMTRERPESITWPTKNHEGIHLQQAKEVGSWIKYYLKYSLEYLGNRFLFLGHRAAYFLVSYEMQAYGHEYDLGYVVKPGSTKKYYKLKAKDKKKAWIMYQEIWWSYCRNIKEDDSTETK